MNLKDFPTYLHVHVMTKWWRQFPYAYASPLAFAISLAAFGACLGSLHRAWGFGNSVNLDFRNAVLRIRMQFEEQQYTNYSIMISFILCKFFPLLIKIYMLCLETNFFSFHFFVKFLAAGLVSKDRDPFGFVSMTGISMAVLK